MVVSLHLLHRSYFLPLKKKKEGESGLPPEEGEGLQDAAAELLYYRQILYYLSHQGSPQLCQLLLKTSRNKPEEYEFSVDYSSFFLTWSFPLRAYEPILEVHDLTYKIA